MTTLKCLKKYPNIIEKINYYLEPMFLDNNLLINIKYKTFNSNLYYLTSKNIPFKYSINYAQFPESTMIYFIELAKVIGIDEAYNILTIIPFKDYKLNNINFNNLSEEHMTITNEINKLLNYNYSWAMMFLKQKMEVELIKQLLHGFSDFHFLEIIYINKNLNNFNNSFQYLVNNIENINKFKYNYYLLRQYKIPHPIAYSMSRLNVELFKNIIEVAKAGYYDVKNIIKAAYFDEIQIEFLKLSRYGYVYEEQFNMYKEYIFNNAIEEKLININNFYIKKRNNDDELLSNKKQKIN